MARSPNRDIGLKLAAKLLAGRPRPCLILGEVTAGFAVTAQWTAFDLIPVGAVVNLQQLSTPMVLFVGPALLAAQRDAAEMF